MYELPSMCEASLHRMRLDVRGWFCDLAHHSLLPVAREALAVQGRTNVVLYRKSVLLD